MPIIRPTHTPGIDYKLMKDELERLKTFYAPLWPVKFLSPLALARAGFFYMKEGDKVQCAFCTGILKNWEEGDVPLKKHVHNYQHCNFAFKLFHKNDDGKLKDTSKSDSFTTACFSPRLMSYTGPISKQMVSVISRLNSFNNNKWPSKTGQTPESMSAAGFYFEGTEDLVRCFYCDGHIKDWLPSCNPWKVHEQKFPECVFINLNKYNPYLHDRLNSKLDTNQIKNKPQPKSVSELQEEIRMLKQQRLCVYCAKQDASVVHLPCGHMISCPDCSNRHQICRRCHFPVRNTVQTFS